MKVLIVEDEIAASRNLQAMLLSIDPTIEIVGITESVVQTVRWLISNPAPELIFMDIQLSDGSSFNIFSAITVETPIIFTTAYDEYAIDAFRVNSIDYLLKPVDEKTVGRALDKYKKMEAYGMRAHLSRITKLLYSGNYPSKILLPCDNKLIPINIRDIACFYSTADHTQVFLEGGLSYSYGKTLEAIAQSLDPDLFYRANRQYIVSRNAIRDITIWFDNRLLVELSIQTPERIFISKNKSADFKRWMVQSRP